MTAKDEFNRQVRLTALLAVGLLAALIFGIIVLAVALDRLRQRIEE